MKIRQWKESSELFLINIVKTVAVISMKDIIGLTKAAQFFYDDEQK